LRHVVGDLALVESARALAGDGFQGGRECGKADHIALFGRAAIEQIMLCGAWIGLELADLALPIPRHAPGDGKTSFRILDRGRKPAIKTEATVRPEDRLPGVDCARHGHRMNRTAYFGQSLRTQRLSRRRGACTA